MLIYLYAFIYLRYELFYYISELMVNTLSETYTDFELINNDDRYIVMDHGFSGTNEWVVKKVPKLIKHE